MWDTVTTAVSPPPPLSGFTVGVTAARRADELGAMLERRGATVQHAPALRIVPLADDTQLLAATRELIERPPDITVATTGIGFRGWVDAANGWGLGEELLRALGSGELIARGPKARGAIRATGLVDAWSPPSESSAEVLEHLLARGVEDLRIAVQLHGEPLPDVVEALDVAGAEVVEVPVYRWMPPVDITPVDRLLDAVVAGEVDVVSFTSAPAAASLLARAGEREHARRPAARAARAGAGALRRAGHGGAAGGGGRADRAAPTLPARRHGAAAGDRDARPRPAAAGGRALAGAARARGARRR